VCPKGSASLEVISKPCKLFPGNINADAAVIQLEFEINIAEIFLTGHFAIRKYKSIQISIFYMHIYIAVCLAESFKPKVFG